MRLIKFLPVLVLTSLTTTVFAQSANSLEGRTYANTYGANSGHAVPSAKKDRLVLRGIVLLTNQHLIGQATTAEELADYINRERAIGEAALAVQKSAFDFTVKFDCHPQSCSATVAPVGSAFGADLGPLQLALTLGAPPKTTGSFEFQANFSLEPASVSTPLLTAPQR